MVFETIIERPGYRLCDILVKNRTTQARALGVSSADYLKTLAYRLRQPPRGLKIVSDGPVKEVIKLGKDVDLGTLPLPPHTEGGRGIITAMNILRDPGDRLLQFLPCRHADHRRARGARRVRDVAQRRHHEEIQGAGRNTHACRLRLRRPSRPTRSWPTFSGLHMDSAGASWRWSARSWIRTSRSCGARRSIINVPAHAEMVIEGWVDLTELHEVGPATAPSMYAVPRRDFLPKVEVTAITMRRDNPIYRNHQTVPQTDHQPLPRLCHEAVLYNRLTEMGLDVKDVRFPTWGGALSCLIQFSYPREGCVNDALMLTMGAPWLNTKLVVALSPDTDLDDPGDVYHAIASRCDPARDVLMVPATRGSPYDPSAQLIEGQLFLARRRQDGHRRDDQGAPRHDRRQTRLAEKLGQGETRGLPLARRRPFS